MLATALGAFALFTLKLADKALAQDDQPPVLTCPTLAECLTLLQKPYPCAPGCLSGAHQYAFIDDQGGYFSLPVQFDKFGRSAVPALLRLLDHPDWTMRARAGMVIANLNAVDATDLPAIIEESRNGNEWIAPALARIGTPEAIIQLINVVRKSPFLEKPHGLALKSLGKKAVPFVLQALTCATDRDCSFFFVQAMGELGADPAIQSHAIQERLLDLATTDGGSRYIRGGALGGLKGWQPYEAAARLRIRPLLNDTTEEIRSQALEVLVSWTDEAAVAPLLMAIENSTGYDRNIRIQWLGGMGPVARSAGPHLLPRLQDDDWSTRERAATALGKIGYEAASPFLVASISPTDWTLTYAALISLRQLNSPEARTATRKVAEDYWQPGIRLAARRLLDNIPEPTPSDGRASYGSPIDSGCAEQADTALPPLASHPDLADAVALEDVIAVDGGRLVMSSGEGGGELGFWPEQGLPVDLIRDGNVVALFGSRTVIYAAANPRDDLDNGFLYRIEQVSRGNWVARKIWRLPGAPQDILNSPRGAVGVVTNHGNVIFRPDRGMEWISCPVRE